MLFATGSTLDRSVVFVQSHVAAHAQAAWLLGAVTSVGELRRMTQFKDKADQQALASADLFTYPVLMAADILLYEADRVPIGDDQRQHLELARDIAMRFNALRRHVPAARGDLPGDRGPDHGPARAHAEDVDDGGAPSSARSGILDLPDVVAKKSARAVTDSQTEVRFDPKDKPGVSNLMEILQIATGEPIEAMAADTTGSATAYSRRRRPTPSSRCSTRCGDGTRSCAPTRVSCAPADDRSGPGASDLGTRARAHVRAHGVRAPVVASGIRSFTPRI